jgi:hypothetical protein
MPSPRSLAGQKMNAYRTIIKKSFFKTSTSNSFPHLVGTNVSDDEIIQALLSSWHEN